MSESIVINFAGEPVAKGRARIFIARGKPMAYTPAKTRKFEAALQLAAQQAMEGEERLLGAVSVSIVASLPVPTSWPKKKQDAALSGTLLPITKPDIDNYAKLVFDALNSVVFSDDRQVAFLMCSKVYASTPGLRIEVKEIRNVPQVDQEAA